MFMFQFIPLDRITIQDKIVPLMMNVPVSCQRQLSHTVFLIANELPNEWPNLVTDLCEYLLIGNRSQVNCALDTFNQIFKKYRSINIHDEYKYMQRIAKPLSQCFVEAFNQLDRSKKSVNLLRELYLTITESVKVFKSLTFHELSADVNENLVIWMNLFKKLLTSHVPVCDARYFYDMRANIFGCVTLHALKFNRVFKQFAVGFLNDAQRLLLTIEENSKNVMVGSFEKVKYVQFSEHLLHFFQCLLLSYDTTRKNSSKS